MVPGNTAMNVGDVHVNGSDNTNHANGPSNNDEVKAVVEDNYVKVSLDEGNNVNTNKTSTKDERKVLERGVTGVVRWFNVKMGYGFIKRNDTEEDVYVYYKSIGKKNPGKRLKSLATDEEVVFDVVEGRKGNEAGNVTGPNGEPVKGSHIDSRYKKNFKRLSYHRKKFNMENKERDPNQKVIAKDVQGKILFFNFFKGYGFIKRDDNNENVFCHIVDIVKKNPKKFSYLPPGTSVRFDIVEGLKGIEAGYVTNEEGNPISGVRKRNRKPRKAVGSSTDSQNKNEGELVSKKVCL